MRRESHLPGNERRAGRRRPQGWRGEQTIQPGTKQGADVPWTNKGAAEE